MHVVWMRYKDELGPSFTLWDKSQNCKFFCQIDADMCRGLSNYFFSKIENSRTKLKKGAIWKLDLGYSSPFSEVLPGWIDTCRQSYRQFGHKLLTCQDLVFLGHYGGYPDKITIISTQLAARKHFLGWCLFAVVWTSPSRAV